MTKLRHLLDKLQAAGWVPVKYLFSSCVAFAVDYVLHLYLNAVIPSAASMEIGAFIAWCCSSAVNFTINRSFVFHSTAPLKAALPEYYSLAIVVHLLKSYMILELLTRVLHLPLGIAKPIAEVVLFVGNYIIQKKFIFKKKSEKTAEK